ncbi:hypothetical protein E3P99_03546 [Wallemia hederae]|uniref:Cytochrome b n=1 Tax=Wallemia hederae TaxID=1540922 RepID=A0A4T0FG66_9BASI|nr:hypothetical protein E3P99_03546 [Wallemia hederae]
MPLLDTSRVRGAQFRPFMRIAFWLFVANLFILGFIGGEHPEDPYIGVGAASTAFYFAIGILENTLADLGSNK